MIEFKKDIKEGLSASPKRLSSKYFYDKKGSELFAQIMRMPEYYLTDAEYDIFKNQTSHIIAALSLQKDKYFELIELGPGDGLKSKELLKLLSKHKFKFDYFPVDISAAALEGLKRSLTMEVPDVSVKSQVGDYFDILESLHLTSNPKVVLFLGSNLGNMEDEKASKFLHSIGVHLNRGDVLYLGVDLIKDSSIVLPAYNDAAGITAAFNLNLLERINRELGGEFDLSKFKHAPSYNESTGIARSAIESLIDQEVTIESIGETFAFKKGEKIHTEISRKYNSAILNKILGGTDFEIVNKLQDSKRYFAGYILKRN